MLVNRSGADCAAAGQEHLGRAQACHWKAEHQNRGAYGADQLVWSFVLAYAAGIQLQRVADAFNT